MYVVGGGVLGSVAATPDKYHSSSYRTPGEYFLWPGTWNITTKRVDRSRPKPGPATPSRTRDQTTTSEKLLQNQDQYQRILISNHNVYKLDSYNVFCDRDAGGS